MTNAQQASLLFLTSSGYEHAVKAETRGLYADITHFRAATLSMKYAVDDNPWGTQVYYGQINDREVLDQNVILMTLIIPPAIDSAEIDSIALYLSDGTIFAQGFLRKPRQKVEGSACYIYAYINAPEPLTDVETWLKARTAFPQVDDYCVKF